MSFPKLALALALQSSEQQPVDAAAEIAGLNYLTMRLHEMRKTEDVDRVCRRLVHGVNSAAMPPRTKVRWGQLFELSNQCIAKLEEANWNEARVASTRRAAEDAAEAELVAKGAALVVSKGAFLPFVDDLLSAFDAKVPDDPSSYSRTTRGVLGQFREKLTVVSRAIEVDKNSVAPSPELQALCIDEEECDQLFQLIDGLASGEIPNAAAATRRYVRATPADPRGHYLLALLDTGAGMATELEQALSLTPAFVKRDEFAADSALRLGFLEAEKQLRNPGSGALDRVEAWLAMAERYAPAAETETLELAIAVLGGSPETVRARWGELAPQVEHHIGEEQWPLWMVRATAVASDGSEDFVSHVRPLIAAHVAERYENQLAGLVGTAMLADPSPTATDPKTILRDFLSQPDPLLEAVVSDPLVGKYAKEPAFRLLFPVIATLTIRSIHLDRNDDHDANEVGAGPELFVDASCTGFGSMSTRDRFVKDRHDVTFDTSPPSTMFWVNPGGALSVDLRDADAFSDDTLFQWRLTATELLEGKRLEPLGSGSRIECDVVVR